MKFIKKLKKLMTTLDEDNYIKNDLLFLLKVIYPGLIYCAILILIYLLCCLFGDSFFAPVYLIICFAFIMMVMCIFFK